MKKRFEYLKKLHSLAGFALTMTLLFFLNGCTSLSPEDKLLQESMKTAEDALKNDNYDAAAKAYIQAIVTAEDVAPEKVYDIKKSLAQNYIAWSRSIYWAAKTEKKPELFTKAIFLCEKAAEIHPKYKVRCMTYISKFKQEMAGMKFQNATSVDALIPDRKERNYKIAILKRQAALLDKERRYMLAKDKFEDILKIDPYNIEAARAIKKIAQKLASAGEERQEADTAVQMAEHKWRKVEPVASKEEAMEATRRDVEAGVKLQERLSEIKIRQIDFKDEPLDKAFNSLNKTITRLMHKDFQFEFKGFNPVDPDCPPITFQAKDIPADGAIEAICNGLKMFPSYGKDTVTIEKLPEGIKKK